MKNRNLHKQKMQEIEGMDLKEDLFILSLLLKLSKN